MVPGCWCSGFNPVQAAIVQRQTEAAPHLTVEDNVALAPRVTGKASGTEALKLAHRGYVMVNGKITMAGTGAELLGREDVRAAYLEGGAH